MLQDAHSRKVSIPVVATVGDTVVVAANVEGTFTDHWTYVHELIGDLASAGNLTVLAIDQDANERSLAAFTLDSGQGITEQDEPGEDNRPRFELKPGEDFVLRVTGGTFNGACHYSIRY